MQSLVKNFSLMAILKVVGALFGLASSALLARIISVEELGTVLGVMASFALLTRIFSFGLGQSAQYFAAQELKSNTSYSHCLSVLSVTIGIIIFVILSFFSEKIAILMFSKNSNAIRIFTSIAIFIPISFIHFVVCLYFLGRRDIQGYFLLVILPVAVFNLFLVHVLIINKGIIEVMNAYKIQYIIAFTLSILYPAYYFFGKSESKKSNSPTKIKSIVKYGLKSYLVSTSTYTLEKIGFFVGIWFTTSHELGIFSIGKSVSNILLVFYGSIGPLLFSYVGSMNDRRAAQNFFARTFRLSLCLFIIISISFALVGKTFIMLLYGKEYELSYSILIILLPGLVFSALQRLIVNYMYAMNIQMIVLIVNIATIAILIFSSRLIVTTYGAIGLAFSITLSFFSSLIFSLTFLKLKDGMDISKLIYFRYDDYDYLKKELKSFNIKLW